MKKLMAILVCLGMLGFAGVASATTFTDKQYLDVTIGEGLCAQYIWGDSFSYTHETPDDFQVPWDIVISASLDISGYWIDDNNDQVQISGSTVGTLTPGGSYGWSWSSWSWVSWDTPSVSTFDISSTFSSWSTGEPLNITITANGDFPDFIIQLDTSIFTLEYKNATASTPVPEPATILLISTGLIGIIGFGRKRLNKKA